MTVGPPNIEDHGQAPMLYLPGWVGETHTACHNTVMRQTTIRPEYSFIILYPNCNNIDPWI